MIGNRGKVTLTLVIAYETNLQIIEVMKGVKPQVSCVSRERGSLRLNSR
jgi:hypothetical protein